MWWGAVTVEAIFHVRLHPFQAILDWAAKINFFFYISTRDQVERLLCWLHEFKVRNQNSSESNHSVLLYTYLSLLAKSEREVEWVERERERSWAVRIHLFLHEYGRSWTETGHTLSSWCATTKVLWISNVPHTITLTLTEHPRFVLGWSYLLGEEMRSLEVLKKMRRVHPEACGEVQSVNTETNTKVHCVGQRPHRRLRHCRSLWCSLSQEPVVKPLVWTVWQLQEESSPVTVVLQSHRWWRWVKKKHSVTHSRCVSIHIHSVLTMRILSKQVFQQNTHRKMFQKVSQKVVMFSVDLYCLFVQHDSRRDD